jgi:hypothetical protein
MQNEITKRRLGNILKRLESSPSCFDVGSNSIPSKQRNVVHTYRSIITQCVRALSACHFLKKHRIAFGEECVIWTLDSKINEACHEDKKAGHFDTAGRDIKSSS